MDVALGSLDVRHLAVLTLRLVPAVVEHLVEELGHVTFARQFGGNLGDDR